MSDPKRWTDADAESSDIERELCAAGQHVTLPAAQKRAMWNALQATLASLPLDHPHIDTASAAGTARTAALSTTTKVILGVGVVGALAVGGHFALAPRPVASAPAAQHASEPAALVTPAIPNADAPTPASDLPTRESPAATPHAPSNANATSRPSSSAQSRESQLREESLAVLEIRRVLRAGDASAALVLLDRARARFVHPVLGQEREALTIEALARSGSTSAARQRADAFLRAYPKSPYAADIRAFTSPASN